MTTQPTEKALTLSHRIFRIKDFFNFESKVIDEHTIVKIKKSTLFEFAGAILDGCLNNLQSNLTVLTEYLDGFNRVIDDMVEDNEEILAYYNVIALMFIKEFYENLREKQNYKETFYERCKYIMSGKQRDIITVLAKEKYITQKDLAKQVNLSPQALANQMLKIRDWGVISATKDIADKRVTYYHLSYDFSRYLQDTSDKLEEERKQYSPTENYNKDFNPRRIETASRKPVNREKNLRNFDFNPHIDTGKWQRKKVALSVGYKRIEELV